MTTRRAGLSLWARATALRVLSAHVPRILRIAVSFSEPLSPSRSLSRFARFFLRRSIPQPLLLRPPRFVPDTRRADPLHYPLLPSLPRPLATAASVHVLRPSGCFPRPISLDLSIYLPLACASTAYQSVSVPRSVSAFSHRFSRSPSRPRRSSASLALSSAVAPLAGPLSVASLCARQAGHGEVKQPEEEQEEEEEEEEASSRSIAKHWAELVYRRIEGERG